MPTFGVWELMVILVIVLVILVAVVALVVLLGGGLFRNLRITVHIEKDEDQEKKD